MKILMMTNTYTPIIGGVERSIQSLSDQFRTKGHDVMIVAPAFDGLPPKEAGVLRVAAIKKFNHTDFSVNLPVPGLVHNLMRDFKPDIVHSHHPFLVGDIALRLSGEYRVPLIFTYHTMYEQYLHYLPFHNNYIKRFVIDLATGYANLANHVIVPSNSLKDVLVERGVDSMMSVIPTGIDINFFKHGDGTLMRQRYRIAQEDFVVGYVGRLAFEKNLLFLSEVVVKFLQKNLHAHFLFVGRGPLEGELKKKFEDRQLQRRVHFTGALEGQPLVDAYHAMDVFAFASVSETQGIVLAEAIASGLPVVALDAPGVRDIIQKQGDGFLINQPDQERFVCALCVYQEKSLQARDRIVTSSQKDVQAFSSLVSANKMLQVYTQVLSRKFVSPQDKDSLWQRAVCRSKTEWTMAKGLVLASQAAYCEQVFEPSNLMETMEQKHWFLKWRRGVNTYEWLAKMLNFSQSQGTETKPGLVLIQIDGFSKRQLQKAFKNREMPFLQGLLNKENYQLYPFYTGVPSTTPAVQGELFYGVKQCVPAFQYYDQKCQRVFTMYKNQDAREIERRLMQDGDGLLKGGSSYSNVFEAEALESHFCVASLGWSRLWKETYLFKLLCVYVLHFLFFCKLIVLIFLEILLASFDFVLGICHGQRFRKEIKFIPTRMFICILLRELITFSATLDIARGLEIIHLNYLGYDEHSHRRGSSSKFAHWPLRGIDLSIARIYKQALGATRRHYDVWIYSDHGQEEVISYIARYGHGIQKIIVDIYRKQYPFKVEGAVQHYNENILNLGKYIDQDDIKVTAIGPTGNIYLARQLGFEEKCRLARAFVDEAHIPIVFFAHGEGQIMAYNAEGNFYLPQQARQVLGSHHPYLDEVTQDLIDLCHHGDAGDFIFSGYRAQAPSISFPIENGSHAGPGCEEMNPFVLLPADIDCGAQKLNYLTTKDLRACVLKFLGRSKAQSDKGAKNRWMKADFSQQTRAAEVMVKKTKSKLIRIMTYNVHNCMGMDGKVSPQRIARVISRHAPDIVALQELDMHRERTGGIDQPHMIAQRLEMLYHFHPNLCVEEERYGNAILSRFPIRLIQAQRLPPLNHESKWEPRGALWVALDCEGRPVHFINTHLGLRKKERLQQVRALLGEEWIEKALNQGAVVLAGDLNALPNSTIYRRLTQHLRDVQTDLKDHKPLPTWFSQCPVGRIDHVFVSAGIEVVNIKVSKTAMDKVASDHLPLIVDLKIAL